MSLGVASVVRGDERPTTYAAGDAAETPRADPGMSRFTRRLRPPPGDGMKQYEIVLGYADVAPELARTPGSLPDAGIYLLDGGFHVAAFGSRGERRLRDAGALLVARLGFGPDLREKAWPGGALVPLDLPRTHRSNPRITTEN
jgi:hypothetical protein